jgi:Kef-type K+ transport system membrane component KefB
MDLLYVLLVLLLTTRACAEVAVRLKQPALLGELMGGILIGAIVASVMGSDARLTQLDTDETFQAILDLAVFFLMLLAGVEMRPKDLARASKRAIPIAVAGMLIPFGLGFMLGTIWLPESDWKFAQSVFIGVALAVTAVPVAVKVLMDMRQLQTKVGQVVVAAAVMDDVLSLVLLAMLTGLISTTQDLTAASVLQLLSSVMTFFVVAWLVGRYLLPIAGRAARQLKLEHAEFTLLIVFGLGLSVLAELLSMHFLIGSFTAGVLFTRNVVGADRHSKVETQTEAITLGFLAPVFFASIGIHLNTGAILQAPGFLLLLLLVATGGKLLGAGVAARFSGFSANESKGGGAAMNARGAVEIIIADIALRAGLFEHPNPPPPAIEYLFSAIVIMAVLTTISSPLALRWLLPRSDNSN